MAKDKDKRLVKKPGTNSGSFLSKNQFAIIVFCFGFLLYANTIPNRYNLDDELVTRNHKLTTKGIQSIPEIFTSPYYSDDMGYAFEYRPVVHVSFALEHQFFPESPHVSHFVNALLYGFLCVLLFFVLTLLMSGGNIYLSLLIVLLFAAHPVHTEVVASIKNRDEMLAFLFTLASWHFILKYSQKQLVWSLTGGGLFFLLALLSKISIFGFAIIIPLSLLFFQRLPLNKVMAIAGVLFIPAFFIINILQPEFKLLLFAVIGALLYLSYVLTMWLQKRGAESSKPLAVLVDTKAFFKKEVFPFNHRLFFPGLYLTLLASLGINIFIFTKTGNYYGMIVLTGLCLLSSLKANGIFKWLLLLAFQLTLAFMQYLISEQFAYIIFLTWCFFALQFVRSETKEDKLIFGSLVVISVPLSLLVHIYPYRSFLFAISLSLIPFVYKPAKKIAKYIFIVIAAVLLMSFLLDFLRKYQYPVSLVPITLAYLALAYFPEKLKIKGSWLFIPMFFSFFFFSFTAKINYNYLYQIEELKYQFSEKKNLPEETTSASGVQQPAAQKAKDDEGEVSLTILPKAVSGNMHRPLDFVENPVMFKDPMPMKIASAFDVMLRYLKLLVIPYPLSYYYGYKIIEPVKLSDSMVIISMIIHGLLILLAFYFFRQGQLIPFFGILYYFISILQFTNIFQAVPGMMGDRYLLGPSLGFCLVAAYFLMKVLKVENISALSQMTKPSKYIIVLLLLVYSGLTIARNTDWKDSLTLFRNDIKHLDQSAHAHNLLGLHLMTRMLELENDKVQQRQLCEEAVVHFTKSIKIYPEFFNVAYDLGRAYLTLNIQDSALVYFKMALRLDSTFNDVPVQIGDIYFAQGKYTDALPYFGEAIRQQPAYYRGYDKLSYVYYKMKNFDKALEVNKEAHRKMPGLTDPLTNIGRTFIAMHQPDSARYYFEKALLLQPGSETIIKLLQQTESM